MMSRGGPFFLFRAAMVCVEVRPESHPSQGLQLWPAKMGLTEREEYDGHLEARGS